MCCTNFAEAVEQLHIAQNHFDHADPEHIDIAIEQLRIARDTVDMFCKKMKIDDDEELVVQ